MREIRLAVPPPARYKEMATYRTVIGLLRMTRDDVTLDDLRRRLTELDRQFIRLAAERKALSAEVARVKRATGHPTRDYGRSKRTATRPGESSAQGTERQSGHRRTPR